LLVNQLLFVFAAFALGGAASRVSQLVMAMGRVPSGEAVSVIDWLLVGAALSGGFIVCWTLALGLAGLSGSGIGLAAGPIAAWAAVRWLLPPPPTTLGAAIVARWQRASGVQRAVILGLVGLAAGCVLEVAREPAFSLDSVEYHLPDVLGWLHSGHAGAVQAFSYDFPVGYYPVTNEVLMSWALGISRSFAPLAAWSVAFAALTLLGLWRLLSVLRVPHGISAAALSAFAVLPVFLVGLLATGPATDLPAVAWLSCAAALSAGAADRPVLLAPALLAAGLGIGTKTTVAPLVAVALVGGAWTARHALGSVRRWLAAGGVAGMLAGGPWYLRDALTHGWPLWPFSSGPGSAPLPHVMKLFDASFLSRPSATVSASPSLYLKWFAGGLALIAGTAAALPARSRSVRLGAAVALVAVLAWAAAPYTGASTNPLLTPLALTTVRYLLSALGACALAVALAGREASPRRRALVLGVFGVSVVGSLAADVSLGFPAVPRLEYPIVGAVVGFAIGTISSRASWRRARTARRLVGGRQLPAALRVTFALLAVLALTLAAPGWLWRELKVGTDNAPVVAFMLAQPGFVSGSQPISFAPAVLATLAGPALRHPISLIGASEPCARVLARLKRGWVVVSPGEYAPGITTPFDAARCLSGVRPVFHNGTSLVYTALAAR
jgi:hypothetical protein